MVALIYSNILKANEQSGAASSENQKASWLEAAKLSEIEMCANNIIIIII